MTRVRITEYLDIDVDREMWVCHVCDHELISAREMYKKGCVVHERDPKEIYPPIYEGAEFPLTVAEGYGVFVEFYCPGCGTMIENELLPEGYPPTPDIQIDLEALKAKVKGGS
ncbi:MAG: acetone carboxylase subunit gamma [Acidimicrobiia bacterium]|nr:acetone carboxylase subunit gamma [Acidimicrobiia bacterium]